MLILSKRLLAVPVMSLQTGSQIAATSEPIIDPRKLKIIAFYVEGPSLDFEPAVLHTEDIRENSDVGFIIDSSDNIMNPDGLVRLQEIIDFQFQLPGLAVVTEHGHKLGTVNDYATDTTSYLIQKIHIKRPFLESLNSAELLVDRSQILEVTNKRIVVSSAVVEAEQIAKSTVNARPTPLVNAFHRTDTPESH